MADVMSKLEAQEMLLARLIVVAAEIAKVKKLYEEQDRLTLGLREAEFRSAEVDGILYTMTDNFADDKNVAYRIAFVRRFEVKTKVLKE